VVFAFDSVFEPGVVQADKYANAGALKTNFEKLRLFIS
jgi:hypothetical protein